MSTAEQLDECLGNDKDQASGSVPKQTAKCQEYKIKIKLKSKQTRIKKARPSRGKHVDACIH